MRGDLSRAAIVAAALALVDEAGLDALSMRRLGRALGVEAMALYHHFPNKVALLDAVVAAITPEPPEPTGDWRQDLTTLSHRYRETVNAHPRLLPVMLSRPTRGARAAATLEAQYAALRRAGLDGSALLDAHRTWGSYVLGYLVVEQQGRTGPHTDAEWRPVVSADTPVTAGLDRYQGARDWDEQFDIGLAMQLDAIAALAASTPA
ncbi:TetR/AcrR family transcriptional regulator C-terminal domain-containing protein [Dactylosporangium vinaceum]|uniref:TetR/AcrR family transcriptional regulator n=1 Tax=Dactylosporangium vinaceum TaxID=53362 RepID=A0ABV5MS85_9ACTN|nr:TetR/AcrR family transcriptional regulator C-terminal domain-containing protein [Dactylosporangium vinaceum]UAC00252.1 TetR/AcrR family transcriptional regulator C-terminal domain-containing protein [Dactylosporangium vinaceum]